MPLIPWKKYMELLNHGELKDEYQEHFFLHFQGIEVVS